MGNPYPVGTVLVTCVDEFILNNILSSNSNSNLHISNQVVTTSTLPKVTIGCLEQKYTRYNSCTAKRWIIPNVKLLVIFDE